MAANMYRVGDYVYFETASTSPYQIRRIEELNKTPNGNVEAKVMCFYRRRDISSSLTLLADKHQNGSLDDEEEKEEQETDISEKQRHQLKHRELFLSRQVETMPATHIRGKCVVTLLNETELLTSYLNKEDTFFYSLVYDPQQKTLLADKGEIRVGSRYQTDIQRLLQEDSSLKIAREDVRKSLSFAVYLLASHDDLLQISSGGVWQYRELQTSKLPRYQVSVYRTNGPLLVIAASDLKVGRCRQLIEFMKLWESDGRNLEELEELIWDPEAGIADRQIDQFLVIARSVGTFARALDCTSTVRQPSLHMSAAAASRDITLFNAMMVLHSSKYDISKAVSSMVPVGGPVLCRDEMEEWSASEANLFEEALDKYGKDFNDIRQDFLPWKSLKSIIEYYYMWKTTDRYVQQKRIKAAEAESKLKQVYIPNYNKPNPAAINNKINGIDGQVSGRACESCYAAHSQQWYSWGPTHMQCRLCSACWVYWKKYGGLKMPTRLDGERPPPTQRSERIAHSNALRLHRCTITGCGKEFKLKAHLARHLATAHGLAIRAGSPRPVMKTRAAFCLVTTSLTRISRRLCSDLLRPHHAARSPFVPINSAAIKQECQLRLEQLKYDPKIIPRAKMSVEPVLSRLGIDTSQDKPALLHRAEGGPKQPAKLFFPPLSPSKQKPLDDDVINKSPNTGPSIMKKRGYEQTNGIDAVPAKRPNIGVMRQAALAMRPQIRANMLNHTSLNGRGKLIPKNLRMHMISWIDAPDDVYFIATSATKKLRRQLANQEFKRVARNPWRSLPIKPSLGGLDQDIVVLD